VPRKRPSVLKSSSMSGQWIPCPPAANAQFCRCWGVALRRRGNQGRGAEILRPSASVTVMASASTKFFGWSTSSATRSIFERLTGHDS
jgi:hypothetical protein